MTEYPQESRDEDKLVSARRWSAVTSDKELDSLIAEFEDISPLESKRVVNRAASGIPKITDQQELSYSPSNGPSRRSRSSIDWTALSESRKSPEPVETGKVQVNKAI